MSVAEKVSYFSRFAVKFVEIVAAGAATAVSGYLVAHFSASWSTPSPPPPPASVQVAPSAIDTPKAASSTPRVQPMSAPSTAADAGSPRPAAQRDAVPPAKPTARATANAAPTAPGRKHPTTDAAATESKAPREAAEAKPRDTAETKPHETTESKPHETAETKPPDWEAVEARIRAALAKADASRPAPPERPAQTAATAPAAVVGTAPKPADAPVGPAPLNTAPPGTPPAAASAASTPPASTVAAVPPAAEVPPQAVLSDPPTAVEIKSRPIAAIDASSSPEAAAPPTDPQQSRQESAQANAPADPQTQVKGFFAAIKHLPDMLRTAAPAADPPRPPAPVGD